MALLTWNVNYSVRVRQFDDQHRRLIDMINSLHDAMRVGKGKDAVGDILRALVHYTSIHFGAEEAMMRLHNYPAYEEHRKAHNLLVVRVLDAQKKYLEGDLPLSHDVMRFLKEWLVEHIQGEDRKYGPFLNSRGVA